jgi:activator of HSP90 ATPase
MYLYVKEMSQTNFHWGYNKEANSWARKYFRERENKDKSTEQKDSGMLNNCCH